MTWRAPSIRPSSTVNGVAGTIDPNKLTLVFVQKKRTASWVAGRGFHSSTSRLTRSHFCQ